MDYRTVRQGIAVDALQIEPMGQLIVLEIEEKIFIEQISIWRHLAPGKEESAEDALDPHRSRSAFEPPFQPAGAYPVDQMEDIGQHGLMKDKALG